MLKQKTAIIFGASGQDGSYLSHYLLKKNYNVIGITRNKKIAKNHKILGINKKVKLLKKNILDKQQVRNIIYNYNCSEIYFLAGEPSLSVSFRTPIQTVISNIIPVYNILEILREGKSKAKFYGASSCEIFKESKKKLNINSKKEPISPYGLSKLISFELIKFYREKFNVKCCSGVLFHHESLLRKKNFLIKKIVLSAKKIHENKLKKVEFGNLEVIKDWGWAPEYSKVIHKILQKKNLNDYIIATGKSVSARYVIKKCFNFYNLDWNKYVFFNKKYLRPRDIKVSKANIFKTIKDLNWKPSNTIDDVLSKLILKKLF